MEPLGIRVVICGVLLVFYVTYSITKFIKNTNRDDISDTPYMKLNAGKKFKLNSASEAVPIREVTSDTVFKPSEY